MNLSIQRATEVVPLRCRSFMNRYEYLISAMPSNTKYKSYWWPYTAFQYRAGPGILTVAYRVIKSAGSEESPTGSKHMLTKFEQEKVGGVIVVLFLEQLASVFICRSERSASHQSPRDAEDTDHYIICVRNKPKRFSASK